MTTLADGLRDEQQRCRNLLIARIDANVPAGDLADAIKRAEWAVLDGDAAEMIRCHGELRGFK